VNATTEDRYEEGLRLYESGAELQETLKFFQDLRKDAPNDVRIAVSLSWLNILLGNKEPAIRYAKEAKSTAQGRYNHALALLTFGEKGVREKLFEAVEQGGHDGMHDALANLQDAIEKKGGSFPPAEKLVRWIQELDTHH